MLPLKEMLLMCLLISSPQMIQLMPTIYHRVIYVDLNGRLLPEVTDSRRTECHFDSDQAVSKETVKWYCRKFNIQKPCRDINSETTSSLIESTNDENTSLARRLGNLEIGSSHLPTL